MYNLLRTKNTLNKKLNLKLMIFLIEKQLLKIPISE
nr:MAG TPA: hypothetical protein [Caudoviricetes sp.]